MRSAAFQIIVEHYPDSRHTAGESYLLFGDNPAQRRHVQNLSAPGTPVSVRTWCRQKGHPIHWHETSERYASRNLSLELPERRLWQRSGVPGRMAVNNAFGIARCCRSVADEAWFVFIAVHRKIIGFRKVFNHLVIQDCRGECGRRHYSGMGHDDIFLYSLELIFKWFNEEVKIFRSIKRMRSSA